MRTVIRVPRPGTAVTEGTLVAWLVEEGSSVAAGTPLYRLETEKVEMEVEAPSSGILHRTAVAGRTYPVGTEVGHIVDA